MDAWFGQFGDSANSWFAWNISYARKSIWMLPMELLDDVCHMESCFGLFRNSGSFGARFVHGLRLMHHSLRNHFGSTCWYFGEEAQVEARFDLFGDSVNLDAR